MSIFRKSKGFTLIELLVVISIISLLSSVVLASLNSARAKARDATRLSNLKQLTNALLLVADKNNGQFPLSGGGPKCLGLTGTCWNGLVSGSAVLNTSIEEFLKSIPTDPLNGSRTKGDAYLYSDASTNVSQLCNNTVYPTGPFLIWVPDNTVVPLDTDCKKMGGFMGCCGSAMGGCGTSRACLLKIQ